MIEHQALNRCVIVKVGEFAPHFACSDKEIDVLLNLAYASAENAGTHTLCVAASSTTSGITAILA